jgi:GNAT superfamily N-acetyltransferase
MCIWQRRVPASFSAPALRPVSDADQNEADSRVAGHLVSAIAWTARRAGSSTRALARYRRQGIGAQLLRHGVENLIAAGARCVKITADESNYPAIRLYTKLGFHEIGAGANYYGDGRDRLIFEYVP